MVGVPIRTVHLGRCPNREVKSQMGSEIYSSPERCSIRVVAGVYVLWQFS